MGVETEREGKKVGTMKNGTGYIQEDRSTGKRVRTREKGRKEDEMLGKMEFVRGKMRNNIIYLEYCIIFCNRKESKEGAAKGWEGTMS